MSRRRGDDLAVGLAVGSGDLGDLRESRTGGLKDVRTMFKKCELIFPDERSGHATRSKFARGRDTSNRPASGRSRSHARPDYIFAH